MLTWIEGCILAVPAIPPSQKTPLNPTPELASSADSLAVIARVIIEVGILVLIPIIQHGASTAVHHVPLR